MFNKQNEDKQTHTGSGDNVFGDKINTTIIKELSFNDFIDQFENLLVILSRKDFDLVKEKIDNFLETPKLGPDVKAAFEIILILTDLKEDILKNEFYQKVISIHSNQTESKIRDWCISSLIRIDILRENFDDAINRYEAIEEPGKLVTEAYYELIAKIDNLESYYNEHKLDCDEIILNALYRGSVRLNDSELTNKIATFIDENFQSNNSQLLKFIAKANRIFKSIGKLHYWCITLDQKIKIDELIDEFLEIVKNHYDMDHRVIELACNFYSLTIGEDKRLLDFCWNNLDQVKTFNQKIAGDIKFKRENNYSELQDGFYEIVKAHNDYDFRSNVVGKIVSSKTIDEKQALILSHLATSNEIGEWIKSGGTIKSDSDFNTSFTILELESISCINKSNPKSKLIAKLDSFLEQYSDELTNVNPSRLGNLIKVLFDLDLSIYICFFIKPLLQPKDLWASPLVLDYIDALLINQQDKTLEETLENIQENQWPSFLWSIKAKYLCEKGNLNQAVASIEKAVEMSPEVINFWNNYLFLKKNNNEDEIPIINNIPVEIFQEISRSSLELLNEFVLAKRYKDIENIIVGWFVSNPIKTCKIISDYLIGLLIMNRVKWKFSDSVGNCIKAIWLKKNSETQIKLLLNDIKIDNEYFISTTSIVGQTLINTKKNTQFNIGMDTYEITSNIAPILAINIISKELRLKHNDGTDIFYSVALPENDEDLPGFLEKKLKQNSDHNEVLLAPNLPYMMIGNLDDPVDMVDKVLKNLISKEVPKSPLPFAGISDPKSIILDVHSSIYLSLVGFVDSLFNCCPQIYMTVETKHCLQHWYNKKIEDDGLNIGLNENGKLLITDSKQIKNTLDHLLKNLKLLLSHSKLVSYNACDLPLSIIKIKNVFDRSTLSTFKYVISKDISWLCIDSNFIHLFQQLNLEGIDLKVINAQTFISNIGKTVEIENKISNFFLQINSNLPYPLTFDEISELSNSTNTFANEALLAVLSLPIKPEIELKDLIIYFSNLLGNLLRKKPIINDSDSDSDTSKEAGTVRNIFLEIYRHLSIRDSDQPFEVILAVLHFRLSSSFSTDIVTLEFINQIVEEYIEIKGLNLNLFNEYIIQYKAIAYNMKIEKENKP